MNEPILPDSWLQRVGFKLGNPFSTREASKESEPLLIRYFMPHPGFDELLGNLSDLRSGFLVASRGHGKTVSRRVMEWACRSGRLGAPVLAVPYTEFSIPLRHADENGRVSAEYHIEAILRQAVPMLLEALARRPENLEGFTGGFQEELFLYLARYTDLLTKRGLDRWLRHTGYHSRTVNAATLQTGLTSGHSPFFHFLAELLSLQLDPEEDEPLPPIEHLSGFVDLADLAGFHALYILIDRLDEREPLADDPQRAARFLENLVTNLPLMELDNTAFKLFITPEIVQALQQHPALRLDRLLKREIRWSQSDLRDLLDRRVDVFTAGKLPSLDAVCTVDAGNLVSRMAAMANGSPRNMLRLGEWLLYWHYARVGHSGDILFNREDFQKAVDSFSTVFSTTPEQPAPDTTTPNPSQEAKASAPPGLWIDEGAKVWRGDKPLGRLPGLQHKLLAFLLKNKGKVCTYDALGDAIYGTESTLKGFDNGRIDKLVQRLRENVEENPSKPKFVHKVPDHGGYVLEGE